MEQEPTAGHSAPPATTREEVSFSGNAGEYFRIWIVNLCLTVVTLGIYSPWAKVRRNKYLYRHTQLAGAGFDYLANPVAILKGRLIALAIVGVYFLTSVFIPAVSLLIMLTIFLIMPWLLVRARMFAMRNTSYRNVRFGFRPVYQEAYKVVLGFSLVAVITLGLAYPWARYRRARMLVDNTTYGTLDMKLHDRVSGGDFFGIYWSVGLAVIGIALLFAVLSGVITGVIGAAVGTGENGTDPGVSILGIGFFQVVPILIYLGAYYAIDYSVTRIILNATSADEHQLRCNWKLPQMLFIQLTNLIAIGLSVGLLIPWATIRLRRYKLSHLSVAVKGDLASIAAGEADEVSALGEEIGEAFDYDFGF